MAINTQTELVTDLQYIAAQNSSSLTETDAVRNLNFGVDRYSALATRYDGTNQMDDLEQGSLPIDPQTLTEGLDRLTVSDSALAISYVELVTSDGTVYRLEQMDRGVEEFTSPESTNTGRPVKYDLFANTMLFDRFADQSYTINIFYSRAFTHLAVGNGSQVLGIPTVHTEFVVLYAAHRLGFRNNDDLLVPIERRLQKFEREIIDYWANTRNEGSDRKARGNVDIRS